MRVSNIQRFSTGDGPGIRTTVFLQGCNLKCKWCHNPETREAHSGEDMSPEEIFSIISEDLDFYKESGGGVTISGGEPLLQFKGCKELAALCFNQDISVIIDTAGCVPYEYFTGLTPYVSCFYVDLKAANREDYRLYTLGDFETVKENLCRLKKDELPVRIRIPVIPGLSDNKEYMEKMAKVVTEAGYTRDFVDLLPFHRMGSGKYTQLGLEYPYRDVEPVSKEKIEELKNHLRVFD